MPSWFRVYRTREKSTAALKKLRVLLSDARLKRYVTHVRVEHLTTVPDKNRTKFFVICFDTPEFLVLPVNAERDLEAVRAFSDGYKQDVSSTDDTRIQKFVGYSALNLSLQEPVHVWSIVRKFPEPLWGSSVEDPANDAVAGEQSDNLLYLLSISATGSKGQLYGLLDTMGVTRTAAALRNLRLLGHLEITSTGDAWSMVSPAIVRVSGAQGPTFVFSGQRSRTMRNRLLSTGATSASQTGYLAPSVLGTSSLPGEPNEVGKLIELVGYQFEYAGEASSHIAKAVPSIDEWESLLPTRDVDPDNYDVRILDGDSFNQTTFVGKPGLYQLYVDRGDDRPRCTALFDTKSGGWREGEFYGLRFLNYRQQHVLEPIRYNRENRQVAVRWSQRWPEIYERSLVLASGRLPSLAKSWLLYDNVSNDLVSMLAEKLGAVTIES